MNAQRIIMLVLGLIGVVLVAALVLAPKLNRPRTTSSTASARVLPR